MPIEENTIFNCPSQESSQESSQGRFTQIVVVVVVVVVIIIIIIISFGRLT